MHPQGHTPPGPCTPKTIHPQDHAPPRTIHPRTIHPRTMHLHTPSGPYYPWTVPQRPGSWPYPPPLPGTTKAAGAHPTGMLYGFLYFGVVKCWCHKWVLYHRFVSECIRLYLQCRKIHGPFSPPGPKIMTQDVETNAISWPGQKIWGTIECMNWLVFLMKLNSCISEETGRMEEIRSRWAGVSFNVVFINFAER